MWTCSRRMEGISYRHYLPSWSPLQQKGGQHCPGTELSEGLYDAAFLDTLDVSRFSLHPFLGQQVAHKYSSDPNHRIVQLECSGPFPWKYRYLQIHGQNHVWANTRIKYKIHRSKAYTTLAPYVRTMPVSMRVAPPRWMLFPEFTFSTTWHIHGHSPIWAPPMPSPLMMWTTWWFVG